MKRQTIDQQYRDQSQATSRRFTPKHLGKQSRSAVIALDLIPWHGGHTVVTLDCTEFTSHCPVTAQPDFGHLVIEYCPDRHIIETKSLKLYLWGFRNAHKFNEAIVDEIAETILRQVKPAYVKVTGRFNTRGGIAVTACAERYTEGEV